MWFSANVNHISFSTGRSGLHRGAAPYQRQTPRIVLRDKCQVAGRYLETDALKKENCFVSCNALSAWILHRLGWQPNVLHASLVKSLQKNWTVNLGGDKKGCTRWNQNILSDRSCCLFWLCQWRDNTAPTCTKRGEWWIVKDFEGNDCCPEFTRKRLFKKTSE
jgi:hypothetical protein